MLPLVGRFATGVFQYFSTFFDQLVRCIISFFILKLSTPAAAAEPSAPTEKASHDAMTFAAYTGRLSKGTLTRQAEAFPSPTIVQPPLPAPLPGINAPLHVSRSIFNGGSHTADGRQMTTFFPKGSASTNWPLPAMSYDMYPILVYLAGCLAFILVLSIAYVGTSSLAPTLGFSHFPTLANFAAELSEDQIDPVDEDPVPCDKAQQRSHPCTASHGQHHLICPEQHASAEELPDQYTDEVPADQGNLSEVVKEALAPLKEEFKKELAKNSLCSSEVRNLLVEAVKETLAPLKEDFQKELAKSSLSNPDVQARLVAAVSQAICEQPAIKDLAKDVRQLSEDMRAVKEYTGAGAEQDNTIRKLSKRFLRDQLDVMEEKIKQLPTCCTWSTKLTGELGPASVKLRKGLRLYGRPGPVGRKVARLPDDLELLKARVDIVLSHRCAELKSAPPKSRKVSSTQPQTRVYSEVKSQRSSDSIVDQDSRDTIPAVKNRESSSRRRGGKEIRSQRRTATQDAAFEKLSLEHLPPLPESQTEAPPPTAGRQAKDRLLTKAKELVVKESAPEAKAVPENVVPGHNNDDKSAEEQPAESPLNRGQWRESPTISDDSDDSDHAPDSVDGLDTDATSASALEYETAWDDREDLYGSETHPESLGPYTTRRPNPEGWPVPEDIASLIEKLQSDGGSDDAKESDKGNTQQYDPAGLRKPDQVNVQGYDGINATETGDAIMPERPAQSNTGMSELSEMFDNASALYIQPPIDDSFQPFFGAEGFDDMEVEAVTMTEPSPQSQKPETDPDIAAFLQSQMDLGGPDAGSDADLLPMQVPGEEMDGVECPHTRVDKDTPMDFDGPATRMLAPQESAEDKNMDDVSVSSTQLPSTVGPAGVIQATPTPNIEMGEAPELDQVTSPPTTSAFPEPPAASALTFPSDREIWMAIPPIGILTRDLAKKFLGRVPKGTHLDTILFRDAVRRCAFRDAGDPHWYPRCWPDIEKDEAAGRKMLDGKACEIRANGLGAGIHHLGTQQLNSPEQVPSLTPYPTADEVYYSIPPGEGIALADLKAKFQGRLQGHDNSKWNALVSSVSWSRNNRRVRKASYEPTTSSPLPPPPPPPPPPRPTPAPSTSDWPKQDQAADTSQPRHPKNLDPGSWNPTHRMAGGNECGVWVFSDSEEDSDGEDEGAHQEELQKEKQRQKQEFLKRKEAGMLPIPKSRKSKGKLSMTPAPVLGCTTTACINRGHCDCVRNEDQTPPPWIEAETSTLTLAKQARRAL